MEVAPGIHQLHIPIPGSPLGCLNSYLVAGDDGWLMIDTGWHTAEAFASLEKSLVDLGIAWDSLSTILVTHVHPDHFGLAGRIRHKCDKTELLTHRWESDLIHPRYVKFTELVSQVAALLKRHGVPAEELAALGSASMPALEFVALTFPDRVLYGGETVSTGLFDLEVIWTPGHSPGHICLYEPKHQLLFSGDHVLLSVTSNVSYHVQSGDNPLGDYLCALRKVQNLPVSMVLPAHGETFPDLKGRVQRIVDHHEKRRAEMREALGAEQYTAYEVASKITWNVRGRAWAEFPPLHKRGAVTETIAHLECMRWEGTVVKEVVNGTVLYGAR